jgi:hypothetical protein
LLGGNDVAEILPASKLPENPLAAAIAVCRHIAVGLCFKRINTGSKLYQRLFVGQSATPC